MLRWLGCLIYWILGTLIAYNHLCLNGISISCLTVYKRSKLIQLSTGLEFKGMSKLLILASTLLRSGLLINAYGLDIC